MTIYHYVSMILAVYTLFSGIIAFFFNRAIQRTILDINNENDIKLLEKNIEKYKEDIDSLEKSVGRINSELHDYNNSLENGESCIQRMKADFEKYKTMLEKLKIDFEKFMSQNNELQKGCGRSFEDIKSSLKNIDDRLRYNERNKLYTSEQMSNIISSEIKNLIKDITQK